MRKYKLMPCLGKCQNYILYDKTDEFHRVHPSIIQNLSKIQSQWVKNPAMPVLIRK
jgi:hypothetical protein